jgi:flagellar assembly protein FliH
LPRVLKGDEVGDGKRIRPLGKVPAGQGVSDAVGESEAGGQEGASVPADVQSDGTVAERHSPQVSAASIERVQRLLHETVASFGWQRAQLLRQLKPGLTKLVIAISERVINRELATDEKAIRGVIDAALDELGRAGIVIARVNPDDAAALRDAIRHDEWHPLTTVELEIAADSEIARGGCVLESDYGQVDATVETQIAQLTRLLDEEAGD